MSTLLMVRHGESTANLALRYTWHDDEPLTELGHRQARETGRRLAARYRPAHLYCSRFHRARQTADGIAAEVGLPVVEIDGIEERYFGELRGKPWAVVPGGRGRSRDRAALASPGARRRVARRCRGAGRAGRIRVGRSPPRRTGDRGFARRRNGRAAGLDRRNPGGASRAGCEPTRAPRGRTRWNLEEPADADEERGRLPARPRRRRVVSPETPLRRTLRMPLRNARP